MLLSILVSSACMLASARPPAEPASFRSQQPWPVVATAGARAMGFDPLPASGHAALGTEFRLVSRRVALGRPCSHAIRMTRVDEATRPRPTESCSGVKSPPQGTRRRLGGLQVLRFIAAALVVLAHAESRLSRVFPDAAAQTLIFSIGDIRHWGHLGVDLCFAISGFIMFWVTRGTFQRPGGVQNFLTVTRPALMSTSPLRVGRGEVDSGPSTPRARSLRRRRASPHHRWAGWSGRRPERAR